MFGRLLAFTRETVVFLTLAAVLIAPESAGVLPFREVSAGTTQGATSIQEPGPDPGPPVQLTPAMLADLETYARGALDRYGVPGAAVAVVQNGRMVYSTGLGVAEQGASRPVTADTRFLIGSVGKGMTAQMIGTLIDDGLLSWDTRVVDILPQFSLEDPASTEMVTLRDLLSMRSGLPRHDVPLFLTVLTTDDIIGSLASSPLHGAPGEAFAYSNQGYAVAGFAAAAAVEGPFTRDLSDAYVDLMMQRYFEPAGMRRLTMDFDTGANDANRASSHTVGAHGDLIRVPLDQERFASPILPAGGATWATVEDLASYLALQLRHGVGPDGRRIVSESAIVETWEPHTPMGEHESFGLGWITGEPYHGLRHLDYNGGNLGYSSYVSILPEAGLGVAVLSNTLLGTPYMRAVTEYAYELAFGLPHDADARWTAQTAENTALLAELSSLIGNIADQTSLALLTGDYGDAQIRFDGEERFVFTNAFGDLPLLPILGMDQAFSIDGLLGGMAQFAVTTDGGTSLTLSQPIGEPQPTVTLIRTGN
jgi:CubicO group peptidase (beta-lactamase class C family)